MTEVASIIMRHTLPLLLACLALLAGCRGPDPSVELLEGELRWMEDQLYMMEDELEQKCNELTVCRHTRSTELRSAPANPRIIDRGTPNLLPAPGEPRPAARPDKRPGAPGPIPGRNGGPAEAADGGADDLLSDEPDLSSPDDVMDDIGPPEIRIPDTGGFESEMTDSEPLVPPRGAAPLLDETLPAPGRGDAFENQSYLEEVAGRRRRTTSPEIDADISHIVVRATVPTTESGTVPRDRWVIAEDGEVVGQAEPTHLRVFVETRNKDGLHVGLPGPISIVILDESFEGEEARIGRWDFDASESRSAMRRSGHKPGMAFEIPWEDIARPVEHLQMFVRYTTVDGRQLEDELALSEASVETESAPGRGGWTPTTRPGGGPRDRVEHTASPPVWSPYR